jgi:hypothetical protein
VITDVPGITPVTIPELEPTVELPLLLVHTPPGGVAVNVVVNPTHTLAVPEIDDGDGFTVTTVVVKHPVGSV